MPDEEKRRKLKKPELLCPAGSLEVLKVAVLYGADAVYLGGEAFSLRAGAKNFTREEMAEGITFAHEHGVKVYVTANILAHNEDLLEAGAYFEELAEMGPDAVLISDPGLFMIARERCPDLPVHISTQANNVNYQTFRFWYDLGVRRVVCGRELSLKEIREIRDHIPADMEIEAFVHGAMCISYSGRCLLSNYLTGRDANRGACTHPCRWQYALMEETRPGEYMPVFENQNGLIRICPSPWNGKERIGNDISAPLGGIIFLEQSITNEIKPIEISDAIIQFFRQLVYKPDSCDEITSISNIIAPVFDQYPIWVFRNNGSEESTKLLRQTILNYLEETS